MPKVTLQPSGQVFEAPRKSNLLRFLQEQQVPIGSACGGHGLCASCKVMVLNSMKGLSRKTDQEAGICERNGLQINERIACQVQILGDIEITTTYW